MWLEDLYVCPRLRGSGLGRALLTEMARLTVERGGSRLEWHRADWNEPALRFYAGLGAELVGRRVWRFPEMEKPRRSGASR
ncbi:MAG: GNAT family N-acetyltransferase [Solirubrobacteraceae bacterium]